MKPLPATAPATSDTRVRLSSPAEDSSQQLDAGAVPSPDTGSSSDPNDVFDTDGPDAAPDPATAVDTRTSKVVVATRVITTLPPAVAATPAPVPRPSPPA